MGTDNRTKGTVSESRYIRPHVHRQAVGRLARGSSECGDSMKVKPKGAKYSNLTPTRLVAIALFFALTSCETPEGPRMVLPSQDLSVQAPEGVVRFVLFNTSSHVWFIDRAAIRIRLDGRTIPTLLLDEYTQLFVEPGNHQLLLEHFDLVQFTSTYTVNLSGRDAFFSVYTAPLSTKYRQVDSLPGGFARRFAPARDPIEWNQKLRGSAP